MAAVLSVALLLADDEEASVTAVAAVAAVAAVTAEAVALLDKAPAGRVPSAEERNFGKNVRVYSTRLPQRFAQMKTDISNISMQQHRSDDVPEHNTA